MKVNFLLLAFFVSMLMTMAYGVYVGSLVGFWYGLICVLIVGCVSAIWFIVYGIFFSGSFLTQGGTI